MILAAAQAVVRVGPHVSAGAGSRAVLRAVVQTLPRTPVPGGPPDSAGWYHAAYIVAAVAYAGYAASLWWRRRCLRTGV